MASSYIYEKGSAETFSWGAGGRSEALLKIQRNLDEGMLISALALLPVFSEHMQ